MPLRLRTNPVAFAAIVATLFAYGCGSNERSFTRDLRGHVDHVVIVVQENRSFDNLFQGFPAADTATYGYTHDGTRVLLEPVPLTANYDLSNGWHDFVTSYDHGKMDGYDLRKHIPFSPGAVPLAAAQYPNYAYVPRAETRPLFDIAGQYVVADRMFQSNIDQSFAAHLYLIAGQAASTTNVPSGRPWGCDAWRGTRVLTLTQQRKPGVPVFPCFNFKTLADELESAGRSWSYYAPQLQSAAVWRRFIELRRRKHLTPYQGPNFGQLWTAYDAVAQQRYGPTWSTNIISPPAQFVTDVRSGQLANVTWIVPDWKNSDHSGSRSDTGPSWVTTIVNAVGESRFWRSSVVLIVWDDSGGWYDHVPPPQLDFDGLGVRVPLIVVSPYAKRGHVSHVQYEFGSIVQFVESTFGLDRLAASDKRANNLSDCFDFTQPPRPYFAIRAKYNLGYFLLQQASQRAPDDH